MLKAEWEKRRALVEEGLVRELRTGEAFDARLAESMEYSLTAGGKRLRPILLMAAADAAGGRGEDYLTSACAVASCLCRFSSFCSVSLAFFSIPERALLIL